MACEVLRAFADAEVPSVLLKGVTLQTLLYGDDELRRYMDVDLLVSGSDLPQAREALSELGFALRLDPRAQPFRMPRHHSEDWRRGRDAVDLHWRLPGTEAPADRAWDVLCAHTATTTLGPITATTLDETGIALLLALHAALHGGGHPKPVEDLVRGVERLDEATWAEAADLARELSAIDAFGAGLRMVPAGRSLAARLSVAEPAARRVRLRAGEQPPAALGVLTIAEIPWREGKARAIVDALVPSPAFMRVCFPLANRGRAGLLLAYVQRGLMRARQLPRALRAVRRSR